MKKLITRLGTILLNEVELGVVLEPSFTDVVLQMYRLSYDITTTVRRIVSILRWFPFMFHVIDVVIDVVIVYYPVLDVFMHSPL